MTQGIRSRPRELCQSGIPHSRNSGTVGPRTQGRLLGVCVCVSTTKIDRAKLGYGTPEVCRNGTEKMKRKKTILASYVEG